MENKMEIFRNEQFGEIRVFEINSEPWFVGKDVSDMLGYTNPSKALADHVDIEDKLKNESLLSLGQRGGWLINESGLYSLILSSKLSTAKQFKRWVTSEVLPSIRRHGSYMIPTQDMNQLSPQLQVLINMELRQREQEKQLNELKLMASKNQNDLQGIREVVSLSADNWRSNVRGIIVSIARSIGSQDTLCTNIKTITNESYTLLDKRLGVSLKRRLTELKKRMALNGATKTKIDKANYLDVINDDKKLIEGYLSIIKDMAIKYGVTIEENKMGIKVGA